MSQCLLGVNCKYNGKNNKCQQVIEFLKDKEYLAVCPEQLGGLPTPRIPCERKGNQVINQIGEDKTKEFLQGTKTCLELMAAYPIDFAVLKAKSPSCGKYQIYDGHFTNSLITGSGVFAEALLERGISVYQEDEIEQIMVD